MKSKHNFLNEMSSISKLQDHYVKSLLYDVIT